MRRSDRAFWLAWVLANALAEAVALGAAFTLGFALIASKAAAASASPWWSAGVAVLLGTLEGVIVGAAQWAVLRRRLPDVRAETWILATAAGAFAAWSLGMLPSALLGPPSGASTPAELPEHVQFVLAAALGAVAGPVLAFAQWWALRTQIDRAWRWIPANAAAWMLGMPVVFVAPTSVAEGVPLAQAAVLFVAVTGVAGAVVGAVHGIVLTRMLTPSAALRAGHRLSQATGATTIGRTPQRNRR